MVKRNSEKNKKQDGWEKKKQHDKNTKLKLSENRNQRRNVKQDENIKERKQNYEQVKVKN